MGEDLVTAIPLERLDEANAIYASLAFVPSHPGRDSGFWILEEDRAVALGRISLHPDGALEVGGFWTAPAHRGRGLARAMVTEVLGRLPEGRTVWCVPFDHLDGFYRSFGMVPPESSAPIPASIQDKLRTCRESACRGELAATTLLVYSA